ncbi:MAG: redoxin family protein [Deltaproteobacteria bacterium]|nr:redoxin family protein [Deltaproteobacteria bacterium]MBI2231117.1 redoxin family protein [Deltaproteobacteria bacterium]MBI2530724.1 redoxin family protein [Deltaproteobacteria bacterium]
MLPKQIRNVFVVGLLLVGLLGTAGLSSALEVGEKAPDFKLPGTMGIDVSLSDFKGKKFVFLEFYGGAFVPT